MTILLCAKNMESSREKSASSSKLFGSYLDEAMNFVPFPEGIIQNPFANASVSTNPYSAKSSSMSARDSNEKLGATSMFCEL